MTTKKIIVSLIFTVFFAGQIFGQNVGISESTFTPNDNSILELKSTLRGFLPPRLTSAERNILTSKIGTEEEGLMIYNTTRKCNESWTGADWQSSDPAGTIKAFGGSTLPTGWLWCDGSEVSRTDYSDLYNAILEKWGEGDDNATINLPDLRGQFLRGVDNMDNTVGTGGGTANIDPNVADRIAKYAGGSTASNVGSYQGDATAINGLSITLEAAGSHSHNLSANGYPLNAHDTANGTGGVDAAVLSGSGGACITDVEPNHNHSTNLSGDNETRSKNAYVNYIIKY